MNKNYDIYFSKSLQEIPWHFPLFRISLTFFQIPWQFPDLEKIIFSLTFPWRVAALNRDLNQGLSHPWSKFGDPSSKLVMSYVTDNLVIDTRTDTHTHTDAGNDNTQSQNWPRVIKPQNHGKNNVHRLKTIKHQRVSEWLSLTAFLEQRTARSI